MTIFPLFGNVFEHIMDPFVFGNPHTIWCKTVNHAIKRGVRGCKQFGFVEVDLIHENLPNLAREKLKYFNSF